MLKFLATVLGVALLFIAFGCTVRINFGNVVTPSSDPTAAAIEPTQEPTAAVTPFTVQELGPVQLIGFYCWQDTSAPGTLDSRLAFYNPSTEDVVLRLPEGTARLRPGETTGTDRLRTPDNQGCIHHISILANDNQGMSRQFELTRTVSGILLHAPQTEASTYVRQFFYDLIEAEEAALSKYVNEKTTDAQLAQMVSWRATIEPIKYETEICVPSFSIDTSIPGSPRQNLSTWRCGAAVLYADYKYRDGSGTWRGTVSKDERTGRLQITTVAK